MESAWPQQPLPQPEPQQPQQPQQPRKRRGLGGVAVGAAALAAKFKAVLFLLPKLKVLTTSASMLVSVAAYTLLFGLPFAVGFVLLILVHEMGHVFQLRREGVKASAPLFIPFMGAVVGMKEMPRNALAEARVGLAGPVLGTVGALVVAAIGLATGSHFWLALAFTGFLINLFNLMPMLPLDGGRAMAAMAPWMWFAGFAGMVALAIFFPNPILILILLLGGLETWRRWRTRRAGHEGDERYYEVAPKARLAVGAVYLGLMAVLAAGMAETFVERSL